MMYDHKNCVSLGFDDVDDHLSRCRCYLEIILLKVLTTVSTADRDEHFQRFQSATMTLPTNLAWEPKVVNVRSKP